ncbi:hypothetical protein BC937DRAFT_94915 [Endogone sp. FLAS-F59071]|nr:hypothetical protein BC937DRAFT_94915 [Endogone sp. FLAS-F59071]|eukprot:RUS13696.1 hypothetical protein BC937DRAFT_94915 [Endogone sp. FLAS-F59071]
MLARSHSNYLAQVSIELTQTSGVAGDAVGRLTIFAHIIVPMSLVAGLWGMNVKVPGRDQNDLVWFFWILAGFAMFTAVGIAITKRMNLL